MYDIECLTENDGLNLADITDATIDDYEVCFPFYGECYPIAEDD